jgi:hypothetical protein
VKLMRKGAVGTEVYRTNASFRRDCESYTVKKVTDFPVPSLDVTYQTLPGRE